MRFAMFLTFKGDSIFQIGKIAQTRYLALRLAVMQFLADSIKSYFICFMLHVKVNFYTLLTQI